MEAHNIFKVIYLGWFLDKNFRKESIHGYFETDQQALNWVEKDLMHRTYSYAHFKGETK